MKVSIIVPIYKGNKYVDSLIRMAERNYAYAVDKGMDIGVQLVLINDYPDIPITSSLLTARHDIEIAVHNNPRNCGIHQSRVNGLEQSDGEYIVFLDQDDRIEDSCLYSQCRVIGTADLVIGNGFKMNGDKKRQIYRNLPKHQLATREKIFLYAANQIVSPGHCLIKRSAVPDEWCRYIIENNGGDDIFLWMLMFEYGKTFALNRENVYVHIDTGENVSGDNSVMLRSAENVISVSRKCGIIPEEKIKLYEKRIKFMNELEQGNKFQKILACIKNIDVCFYKIYAYYR